MVSIIVPIYNAENYLHRCIDSILAQTYEDIEIILVDDGSTDQSSLICEDYKKRDRRIRVIHKPNGGLSDARNSGIAYANGEYILLVDSDDFVHPEIVENMLEYAIKNNADIVMCDNWCISESELPVCDIPNKLQTIISEDPIECIVKFSPRITIAWNKLYKKDIFLEIEYPNGRLHEDEYVIHHILERCRKFVYINQKYYYYMKHEGTITASLNKKRVFDILDAYKDRIIFLKSINRFDILNVMLSNFHNYLVSTYQEAEECPYVEKIKIRLMLRKFALNLAGQYCIQFKPKNTLLNIYFALLPNFFNSK